MPARCGGRTDAAFTVDNECPVPYADWATTNNSLRVVTHTMTTSRRIGIASIIIGQSVKAGRYAKTVNHHDLLATLEQMSRLIRAAVATRIIGIWN